MIQALVHRINAAARQCRIDGALWRAAGLRTRSGADSSLGELARDIEAGAVETLIVLDANPGLRGAGVTCISPSFSAGCRTASMPGSIATKPRRCATGICR